MWSSSRSRLTGADAEENDENEMSVLKHRRSVDDAEDASEHQHLLPTQTDNLGLDVDKHPNDPTLSELQTLRRVSDKIPLAAFSIVIVELCERFAYYGLSGPFQNYLQNPLPEGGNGAGAPPTGSSQPAGAIGLGQSGASGLQMTMSVRLPPLRCHLTTLLSTLTGLLPYHSYIHGLHRGCLLGSLQDHHDLLRSILSGSSHHNTHFPSFRTRRWMGIDWMDSRYAHHSSWLGRNQGQR
jgi:hypothetical protein